MSRLEVVSAVIVRVRAGEARVLLTQRDPDLPDFGLLHECPGGRVEDRDRAAVPDLDGPSSAAAHRVALARELREELGVSVGPGDVGRLLHSRELDPPAAPRPTVVMFFEVRLPDGAKPMPVEAAGLTWANRAELGALSQTPGNVAAVPAILALMSDADGLGAREPGHRRGKPEDCPACLAEAASRPQLRARRPAGEEA